jgi:hypothetical protein
MTRAKSQQRKVAPQHQIKSTPSAKPFMAKPRYLLIIGEECRMQKKYILENFEAITQK